MAPDFLMQQMEWREALQDAVEARAVDQLDALLAQLRRESASDTRRSARCWTRAAPTMTRRPARRRGN